MLHQFLENPENFLWTILVGSTLANFLILGWLVVQDLVVVAVKAAALNRRDVWIRLGKYAGIKLPTILGSDGAGVVAAVGAGVSELSIAFVQSIEMGATLEDIAATIHPHPTLGEAVQEAALRALGHALHI